MKQSKLYNLINILIILSASVLFFLNYKGIIALFNVTGFFHLCITIVTVILVHVIKASRLYFTLYGSEIGFAKYIKTYCKVTSVTLIFPLKLGEFFRMYCYGSIVGNPLKGTIIVLLDRFMDTIALITMFFLVWVVNGGSSVPLIYLLFLFSLLILLSFIVFPGIYIFWKSMLLKAKASKTSLRILRVLEAVNSVYIEIKAVTSGRGTILYFLSLLAWGVEISSIAIINNLNNIGNLTVKISEYLSSAVGVTQTNELSLFSFISVILLISVYLFIKTKDLFAERK